ncbi:MAG TPA: protein kinase [Bryobacteraceae bacterium]|nr:protein kinase [Bryobacteraceae bacterium]
MPLSPGDKLGSYEILAPIGAGGMGEVYRARDTKLKRDVAIKVLPEAFARDPERMARFQREAEVLASLNHPNIAAIYGLEDRALVMELVEGASPKGPIPFDDAWKIASQIATALEYAHDKGIIHRDLKPTNVKITPEGVVKLLDFGLAKAFSNPREPSASPENSPTLTLGATEVGVILGTAAYMAPEQARGKRVDKRADIWSFGVVLYELLTGERLFSGEDAAETLADVIHKQPDLAKVPREVRRVLEECLQKDPKRRLRDIGDAQRLLGEELPGEPTSVATPFRSRFGWLAWAVAGLLLATTLGVSVVHFRELPPTQAVIQFSILSPENSSFRTWAELSPDGKYLAYGVVKDGFETLWLRPLNSQQARPLIVEAGTPFTYAFWSPDSRWIAYAHAGKLKKVDITAASLAPLVICDCVANFRGGAWSSDGVILFAPNPTSAILRVPAAGGSPVAVTTVDVRMENLHRFPTFLPDGRHFLYIVGSADRSHAGVYLGDLQTKSAGKRILDSDSHAVFVPRSPGGSAGHLLFVKDDSLRAVLFDAQRLEVLGEPTVVATGVDQLNSRGAFSASGNGILAYWAGNTFLAPDLNWYGRDGKLQGPVPGPAVLQGGLDGLSLSPDSQWLAVGLGTTLGGTNRVWLFDLSRGGFRPLAAEKNSAVMPIWSADSKRLAFGYSEAGAMNLFVQLLDQPNSPEHLLATASPAWPTDWSQDGSLLVYTLDNGGQYDLWVLSLQDKKTHAWLRSNANESQGQLAPGSANPWWMSYLSDESGRGEVYLESFTLEGRRAGRVQVSTAGGSDPRWRGDGRELYYTSADGKVMAVEIRPDFTAGPPKELFTPPPLAARTIYVPHRFGVTRDGRRFVIATRPADQQIAPLSVIVNWQGQLQH